MMHGDSKALVSQGISGTGAAVVYDDNHFNPVQFTEDLVNDMNKEREKKKAETQKKIDDELSNFTPKTSGMYWRDEVIKAGNDLRKSFATSDRIGMVTDPAHPNRGLFENAVSGFGAMTQTQVDLNKVLENDLAAIRNPNNAGKIDPESVELIKKATSVPLAEAARMYQENGGTLIKPAFHIEDLAEQVSYVPPTVVRDSPEGRGLKIVSQEFEEKPFKEDVDAVINAPQNAEIVSGLLPKFKNDKEALAKEIMRLHTKNKKQDRVVKEMGVSGGPSSSSIYQRGIEAIFASDQNYKDSEGGRKNTIQFKSQGQDLKPFSLQDEYGRDVLVSNPVIALNADNKSGVIQARVAKRNAELTQQQAENLGLDNVLSEKDADGNVHFYELERKSLPLNDTNIAILTRINNNRNPLDQLISENNRAGKSRQKKSSGETQSSSETQSGTKKWSSYKRQ